MTIDTGKVISVFSSKGGVSKSFLSSYLAFGIAKTQPEAKILVIDFCKNSHIGTEFGIEKKGYSTFDWYSGGQPFYECLHPFLGTNIFVIPSNQDVDRIQEWTQKKRRINREYYLRDELVQELKANFDYIIFDNHPSENDEKALYNVLASDAVVLATICELKSMMSTLEDVDLIREIQENFDTKLLVSLNRVDKTRGDLRFVDEFTKLLKEKGIRDDEILPYIRYSNPLNKQTIHSMSSNPKFNNKYIFNVLDDVMNFSKEVIKRV